jgi:hypothetical protein
MPEKVYARKDEVVGLLLILQYLKASEGDNGESILSMDVKSQYTSLQK